MGISIVRSLSRRLHNVMALTHTYNKACHAAVAAQSHLTALLPLVLLLHHHNADNNNYNRTLKKSE